MNDERRQWDGTIEQLRKLGEWAGDYEEGEPRIDWVIVPSTYSGAAGLVIDVYVHTPEGIEELAPGMWLEMDMYHDVRATW